MAVVDVSEIIEQQKLSRFLIGLVTISWIIKCKVKRIFFCLVYFDSCT